MSLLQVRIEVDGEQIAVGKIAYNDWRSAVFSYDESYLENSGKAISLSLPLQREFFSAEQTKNFFEGLLPEGFTRRAVAQWLQVDENDYVAILRGLGTECLGAVQIIDETFSDESHYERLGLNEVKALANEGAEKSAAIMTETHLSLAGASGKVGLYYSDEDTAWYLPKGIAPSTHIVKQSHVRLKNIVANEQLALMTARRLGIDTSESFIVNTGTCQDGDVLLASKRYDRTFLNSTRRIDGLPRPLRLHQEDFAQALGIGAENKYEKPGQHYMKMVFELLGRYSVQPIKDKLELWRRIVFNYLIGNTDGHIKNFSLLYSSDLSKISLAPAYDVVSTTVYPQSTRKMSIAIAGEFLLDNISRDTFMTAAGEAGLGKKLAGEIIDELRDGFISALEESADELAGNGFENAVEIAKRIEQTGGIAII